MSMRLRLYPVALAALLLAPPAAHASNFTVTPTEVNLSTSATSGLVTLRNGSKTALRFEVTLFKWSEDEKGKMTLEPSADVTFFPKLVELAAGASRNIRVGINRRRRARRRAILPHLHRGAARPIRARGQHGRAPYQGRDSGVRPADQTGSHGRD